MNSNELVFSGMGVLTSQGVGLADHLALLDGPSPGLATQNFSLTEFKPAPLLSDRRLLKSISPIDAIGLVGIEDLLRQISYESSWHNPGRVGLFVGSPPAHAIDGALHHDAMEASRDTSGHCSIREFGQTSACTRPTAILSGLPNNTLCYGAMLLEARGPNSNYNGLEISGHTAVINAARAFKRGRLDFAVAGAFSGHTFEPNKAMFARVGPGLPVADGAVFLAIEPRSRAASRQSSIYATYISGGAACDALGPLATSDDGAGLEEAVTSALSAGGVAFADVGLIMTSGCGTENMVRAEQLFLQRLGSGLGKSELPAQGSLAPLFGNLMEAGGLLEIAFCKQFYERGQIPASLVSGPAPDARILNREKRHAIILRTSIWGEYSCLLIRVE